MLPCESDGLTRCCSTIPKAIESANARGSRRNEVVPEPESTRKLASVGVFEISEESTYAPVSFAKAEDTETTFTNAESNRELQPIHERMLNRIVTPPPFPEQYRSEDKLVKQEIVSYAEEDQDLIQQATSFESFRTFPKKPVSLPFTDSESEEQKSARDANSLIPGKVFFNSDYRSEFSSIPKRVAEESSDPLGRKTSLGTLLTLDGASTRAVNENASSSSGLDDDTSISGLSEAEDAENIKRVARSHDSELDERSAEETRNFSYVDNASASTKLDEKKEVPLAKGFKRPPRVLPIRNLRSEERASGKFASSKERAKSLFDKSNEARRKQVSFIINRNDPRMKKFRTANRDSTSTQRVDSKYSDSDRNETSSAEETTRLVDKTVTDSIELS